MMNYRNPSYNHMGTIDCEIEHPVHGWIPTTLGPDEDDADRAALYQAILAEAEIAPYVPPPIEEQRQRMPPLYKVQFWKMTAAVGVTKEQMIEATSKIADPVERAMAIVDISETDYFTRLHPAALMLTEDFDIPAEQVDDLWMWATTL